MTYRSLRVALLGAGSVGANVASLLLHHADELEARSGARLELVGVGVRDLEAERTPAVPKELLTTDLTALSRGADIVIELLGGIEPALTLLREAIAAGADVVTANKALVAAHGPELFEAAAVVGAQVAYEAAVGGAIPIIRPLEQSLAGDRIMSVMGIVNGTTNFILDRMLVSKARVAFGLRRKKRLPSTSVSPTMQPQRFGCISPTSAVRKGQAWVTVLPGRTPAREPVSGGTSARRWASRELRTGQRNGRMSRRSHAPRSHCSSRHRCEPPATGA